MAHGADQLITHMKAAQTLSRAREEEKQARARYAADQTQQRWDLWEDSLDVVLAAKSTERKAYLAYTNPFGAVKTFS